MGIWIGVAASVATILGVWLQLRQPAQSPVSETPVSRTPDLPPVVPLAVTTSLWSADGDMSLLEFPTAPNLVVEAQAAGPIEVKNVRAVLQKSGGPKLVCSPTYDAGTPGKIHADFEAGRVIQQYYGRTPHGIYQARFEVFGSENVIKDRIAFNYVFEPKPQDLFSYFVPDNNAAFARFGSGGVRINNTTRTGGHVTARIEQEFDFITNFRVSGQYQIRRREQGALGLEVRFCDADDVKVDANDAKVVAILGDGPADRYTIKRHNDLESNATRTHAGYRLRSAAGATNYFAIDVIPSGERESTYEVFVGPDPAFGKPVVTRTLPNDLFPSRRKIMQIRLWQNGEVVLQRFAVKDLRDPRQMPEIALTRN
jgi:hypothetical protein